MKLKDVFEQLQNKRVLILGDVILDTYIWGDVHRISPEAPVPIFESATERRGCGGAANVAQNVARLGGNATLIGVIGKDAAGEKLVHMLAETPGVTPELQTDPDRPTSTKTRVIAANTSPTADGTETSGQHLLRIDRESKERIPSHVQERLLEVVIAHLPSSHAIIFADYDKGVLTGQFIEAVLQHAKPYGIPIVVDPKQNNFWRYHGVTAITPNYAEASTAVREKITDLPHLVSIGEKILDRLALQALLITRDAEGMSLFERDVDGSVRVKHLPPYSGVVRDVTGAGDTVIATFTVALAANMGLSEAAMLSNLAGGIAVGKMGCATLTPAELLTAAERVLRKSEF